jgi:Ran GTPase-activating protein (RanGAP) involved in mRNA processing and transport
MVIEDAHVVTKEGHRIINLSNKKKFFSATETFTSILKFPAQLVHLEILNVSDQISASKPQTFGMFVDVIKHAPNLRSIKAENNNICPKHVEMIRGALLEQSQRATNTELEELHLNYNDLSERGAFLISDLVKACPNLKKLGLNRNSISIRGIGAVCAVLINMKAKIEFIDLSDNAEYDAVESMGDVIFSLLTNCRFLSQLHVDGSYLGEYSISQINRSMILRNEDGHFCDLTYLSIENNLFDIQKIYPCFSEVWVSKLVFLDLSKSCLGDNGVSEVLISCRANELERLRLTENEISDYGLGQLVRYISLSKVLTLNLEKNWLISSSGVQALIHAMSDNPNLLNLKLAEADCTEEQEVMISHLRSRNLVIQQLIREQLLLFYVSNFMKRKGLSIPSNGDLSFITNIIEMSDSSYGKVDNLSSKDKEYYRRSTPFNLNILISNNFIMTLQNERVRENTDAFTNASEQESPEPKKARVE